MVVHQRKFELTDLRWPPREEVPFHHHTGSRVLQFALTAYQPLWSRLLLNNLKAKNAKLNFSGLSPVGAVELCCALLDSTIHPLSKTRWNEA